MSVFAPTSPSPGPGYVWNVAKGVWDPPAGAPAAPAPSPTNPTGQVATGGPGATDPNTGLSNGARSNPAGYAAPTNLQNADGSKPSVDYFDGSGLTAQDKAALADPYAADKAAAAKDAAQAQALRDAVVAERNPAAGVAPQVSGLVPVPSAQVGSVGSVGVVAPKAAAAVAPTTIGAPTIQGATVAGTPLAQAVMANAAKLNLDPQAQFRTQQQQLSSAVLASAIGTGGPSAAELQNQRAAQAAAAQQLGLVGMNHGRGAGGALRVAGQNIARIQSDAALANGILRAKETETARGQAIEATGQARGQDIGVAGTEAGFQQGANLQNSQLGTAVAQSNAGLEANRALEDARLAQQTQTTNATLGVDVGKSNQDAALRAGIANAQNEQQANIVGATEANKVAMSNQDVELKTRLAQAGFDQQSILQMSEQDFKAKLANAGFQLTQEQIDGQRKDAANSAAIQMTTALLNYRTGVAQQDLQRQQLAAQIEQARRSGDMQLLGTLLTVGGAIVGTLIEPGGGTAVGAAVGGAAGSALSNTDTVSI